MNKYLKSTEYLIKKFPPQPVVGEKTTLVVCMDCKYMGKAMVRVSAYHLTEDGTVAPLKPFEQSNLGLLARVIGNWPEYEEAPDNTAEVTLHDYFSFTSAIKHLAGAYDTAITAYRIIHQVSDGVPYVMTMEEIDG